VCGGRDEHLIEEDADGVNIACADADAGEAIAQRLRRTDSSGCSPVSGDGGDERRRAPPYG
jgi:hypothetical protein